MKVDAYKSNNTHFTALYMPTKNQTAAKVGEYVAQQAELARPELEKLAEDMNIYIEPFKLWYGSGFDISFARLGNHNIRRKYDRSISPKCSILKEDFDQKNADIPTIIVNKVKELKEKYPGFSKK